MHGFQHKHLQSHLKLAMRLTKQSRIPYVYVTIKLCEITHTLMRLARIPMILFRKVWGMRRMGFILEIDKILHMTK